MHDTHITIDTAKLAKEVGFNVGCTKLHGEVDGYIGIHTFDNYNKQNNENQFSAPTQSLLQKWLRETHKIIVCVNPMGDEDEYPVYYANVWTDYKSGMEIGMQELQSNYQIITFKDYEVALEDGLQKGLNILKQRKK